MFTHLFPILTTPDLPRALEFYRELLGGTVTYEFPDPEGEPAYVGIDIGTSHLGIGKASDGVAQTGVRSMSLWLYADDCDAAVERLRAGGMTITEEPTDQPWGERVARVLDPDGNELIIGQRAVKSG